MRPDRIIIGEVRGGEAFDMLQAMNTGHDGSMSTVHATPPRAALPRPPGAQRVEDRLALAHQVEPAGGDLQALAPRVARVHSAGDVPALEEHGERLRGRLLRDRHAAAQVGRAVGPGRDRPQREVVGRPHVGVAASRELEDRRVDEAAVAPE